MGSWVHLHSLLLGQDCQLQPITHLALPPLPHTAKVRMRFVCSLFYPQNLVQCQAHSRRFMHP